MKHFIITGASRGLGAALARELLGPGHSVFCVSRSLNEELIQESNEAEAELHWIQADLAETLSIEAFMATIAERIDTEGSEQIVLVNNAAVLTPLGLIGSAPDDELQNAVQVNLIAPMILTHSFTRHFAPARCEKVVINVSSGAGTSPMAGLSTYSTTKAALNMFTRAAATEYPPAGSDDAGEPAAGEPAAADTTGRRTAHDRRSTSGETAGGFRFYAVSPGTVDTAMQEALRSAGPSLLPHHEMYVEWKESGALVEPQDAARAVLSLLDRTDIQSGSFVHRRDL
jgi:benzil reductase ((S)-benzoin forming)